MTRAALLILLALPVRAQRIDGGGPFLEARVTAGPLPRPSTAGWWKRKPQPGRRSEGGVADGRSTPINRRLPDWWRRHLADTAVHLAATSADAASSWGRPELHPALRSGDGRFGGRGLSIKIGIFASIEIVKWRAAKRHPRENWVRALSLGPAAIYGGVAARNWRVR